MDFNKVKPKVRTTGRRSSVPSCRREAPYTYALEPPDRRVGRAADGQSRRRCRLPLTRHGHRVYAQHRSGERALSLADVSVRRNESRETELGVNDSFAPKTASVLIYAAGQDLGIASIPSTAVIRYRNCVVVRSW